MTNGYNELVVVPALERIGWKQPTEKGFDIIDCDNQVSTSGRYFNDDSFHTALTFQNIMEMQSDPNITDEDINAYLVQLRKSNIIAALNAVFDTPQFIESGLVYNRPENTAVQAISTGDSFRGIRIKVCEGNYGVCIKSAIIFMDGVATFPLYLFHSLTDGTDTIDNVVTDVTYLKKWSVTSKSKRQVVVPINQYIHYSNEAVKGGHYFIGYFDADLGAVKPLNYSASWQSFKIFNAQSFSSKVTGAFDFDRDEYPSNSDMCGLNLEMASYRDLSTKIADNAHLFDNLQGLMMAAKVIELIYHSTRSNATQRIGKENIALLYRDLNQVTTTENPFGSGLKKQIAQEVAKVRKAFTKKASAINVDL